MTYNLHTKISANDTKIDLYQMFEKWDDAELLAITNAKDYNETALVSFLFRDAPVRVEYGLQGYYASNLRAIYLTLEALRLSFHRGLGDILTGTVSQMLKLGQGAIQIDPYELLGIRPNAPLEVAEGAYRALAKSLHPDTDSGDNARMVELNAAIERVREERKVSA